MILNLWKTFYLGFVLQGFDFWARVTYLHRETLLKQGITIHIKDFLIFTII